MVLIWTVWCNRNSIFKVHVHIRGDEIKIGCWYSPWKFTLKSQFEVAWMNSPLTRAGDGWKLDVKVMMPKPHMSHTNQQNQLLFTSSLLFFSRIEISLLCLFELNSRLQKWLRLPWVPSKGSHKIYMQLHWVTCAMRLLVSCILYMKATHFYVHLI